MASTSATPELKDIRTASYKADEVNFEYSFPWPLSWLFIALHSVMGAPYAPFDVSKSKRHVRDNKQLQARCAGLSHDLVQLVRYHQDRVRAQDMLVGLVILIIFLALSYVLYPPFWAVWGRLRGAFGQIFSTPMDWPTWTALGIAAALFVGFVVGFLLVYIFLGGVAQRVIYILSGRIYAPSLCANSVVMVNFFLIPDNALTNPEVRQKLLAHIRDLAQNTLLLPLCYRSPDAATQRKTYRHFKELESYVRVRERQAITPANTTLDDLRRDFKEMAAIYLTGQYGRFKWQDAGGAEPAPPESRWKGVPAALLRFVGFILPLGLMGAYLWQPALFPDVNVDKKVVGLIFIAWLLLALDAGLKLGVVSQLTSIAKGIKDLK